MPPKFTALAKAGVHKVAAAKRRYVCCPVCGASMPKQLINDHLDKLCLQPQHRASSSEKTKSFEETGEHAGQLQRLSKPKQQWWKQADAVKSSTVAYGKLAKKGKAAEKVPLTAAELLEVVPCELIRKAIPKELADKLLQDLLGMAPEWIRGTWFMFGKAHAAPRTSCYFNLAPVQETESSRGVKRTLDVAEDVLNAAPSAALRQAGQLIDATVTAASQTRSRELMPDDRAGWSCSYALANLYKDGQEGVGPHSDRLQTLGPRAIIASLSLGAARTFRLSRAKPKGKADSSSSNNQAGRSPASVLQAQPNQGSQQDSLISLYQQEQDATEQVEMGKQGPTAAVQFDSVDIELSHGDVVIMWPPTQEEWKHEVPKCKSIQMHPLSGAQRVNLTFRKLKPDWEQRAPLCRCNRQSVLKAAVGHGTGASQRYYYQCDNTKSDACGFWKWLEASELGSLTTQTDL